jgi:hypothetical protein
MPNSINVIEGTAVHPLPNKHPRTQVCLALRFVQPLFRHEEANIHITPAPNETVLISSTIETSEITDAQFTRNRRLTRS